LFLTICYYNYYYYCYYVISSSQLFDFGLHRYHHSVSCVFDGFMKWLWNASDALNYKGTCSMQHKHSSFLISLVWCIVSCFVCALLDLVYADICNFCHDWTVVAVQSFICCIAVLNRFMRLAAFYVFWQFLVIVCFYIFLTDVSLTSHLLWYIGCDIVCLAFILCLWLLMVALRVMQCTVLMMQPWLSG